MGVTIDLSDLGVGLSNIAAGIERRKKEREIEGFVGSVNLLEQIASDQEVTPEETAQYMQRATELGLQVPDTITDLGALRQSILSKFPVLAYTNREALDQPIAVLQKQQAAIQGLQGLLPELYKINPGAAEGIRSMISVDPQEALKMTTEMWGDFHKNLNQSFGTGIGQSRAFTEGGGREVFEYKEQFQTEQSKELKLFQHNLNKDLTAYRQSLSNSGASKMTPKTQTDYVIKFNDIILGAQKDLVNMKKEVNTRLNTSLDKLNTEYPADMAALQGSELTGVDGQPITNFDVIMSGIKGAKADPKKTAAESAADSLIKSGRITGTAEELQSINNILESYLSPKDPGTSAIISGPGKQLLENLGVDLVSLDKIKEKESQFGGYRNMSEEQLVDFAKNINDPQAINALNAYFSAAGLSESVGNLETPSGMGSDLGLEEMSRRIQQITPETTWEKTKKGIGDVLQKIMPESKPSDESIKVRTTPVKVDKSGKVVEEGETKEFVPENQSKLRSEIDAAKQAINEAKTGISPTASVPAIVEDIRKRTGSEPTKEQIQELVDTINNHNKSVGGLQ